MTKQKSQTLIGIDVSKEKLDIYNLESKKLETIKNDVRCIGSWLSRTRQHFTIDKIVLEPTGGYEEKLVQLLCEKSINTFFAHTTDVFYFKKSQGEKAKTDKIDALYIARYAQAHADKLKPINKAHMANKELAELVRTRRQIKTEIHRLKAHAEHAFHTRAVKLFNKRILKLLRKELANIEAAIEEAINKDEEKKQTVTLLKTIKGIGPVNANTMVACVPELGKIDNQKLSSLIGVAPFNQDSGKLQGKRSIQGGRADVRCVLYMAALVAIRFNPDMKAVYERLRSRGKLAKVAIVAVMRRLLRMMNAIARDRVPCKEFNDLAAQKA